MALTKEQFSELRSKGLSVDQIVKFEGGASPSTTSQQQTPTKITNQQMVGNIMSNAGELINPSNYAFNPNTIASGGPTMAPAKRMMSGISKGIENLIYQRSIGGSSIQEQVNRLPGRILPVAGTGQAQSARDAYNKFAELATPRNIGEFAARQVISPENMAYAIAPTKLGAGMAGKLESGLGGAEAFAKNRAVKEAEQVIKKTMTQTLKPSVSGKNNSRLLKKFEDDSTEAVKTIIDNSDGPLPSNFEEYADSIFATKRKIWSKVEQQADKASYYKADISPVVKELQSLKNNKMFKAPENRDALAYIDDEIGYLTSTDFTAKDLLDRVSSINQEVKRFYSNAGASNAQLLTTKAMVGNRLNSVLEKTIENLTGGSVAGLKKQYGALTAIEKDVARRAFSEAKGTNVLDSVFDLVSANDVIGFLAGDGPRNLIRATLSQGTKGVAKWLRSPDRAVSNMFKKASILRRESPVVRPPAGLEYTPPMKQLTGPPPRLLEGPRYITPEIGPKRLPSPRENDFVEFNPAQASAVTQQLVKAMKDKFNTSGMMTKNEQRWFDMYAKALNASDEEVRAAIELSKRVRRVK